MSKMYLKAGFVVLLLIAAAFIVYALVPKEKIYSAAQNEVVELTFELDKKFEFGDYYFDVSNGDGATYPLCFCLTEKNMFPPDCKGDVKYIYHNSPGIMCIPLHIGEGRCSSKIISTSSFATMFSIPLEYAWTKPFETIAMGVQVPESAPTGARLVIKVTIFKKDARGGMAPYRTYTKKIIVKEKPKSDRASAMNVSFLPLLANWAVEPATGFISQPLLQ